MMDLNSMLNIETRKIDTEAVTDKLVATLFEELRIDSGKMLEARDIAKIVGNFAAIVTCSSLRSTLNTHEDMDSEVESAQRLMACDALFSEALSGAMQAARLWLVQDQMRGKEK